MNIASFMALSAILCSLLIAGCAKPPILDTETVAVLAEQAAKDAGKNIDDYQEPGIGFEKDKRYWTVYYVAKPNSEGMITTGDNFFVHVDDSTRTTRFVLGR